MPKPVTLSVSCALASLSTPLRLIQMPAPAVVEPVTFGAIGAVLTPVTVTLTLEVEVPPCPSDTV